MHSESFMEPKTLEVLRNIPKPLCRYWWNEIFQNSYAWKWILGWMYKGCSIGRSPQLGNHLPSSRVVNAESEMMTAVVKRQRRADSGGEKP